MVVPLPPRQVQLESDQFRARQTLEALRFGIVPVEDVQTLTIGLEAEGVSLNRAIDRSRERGGDVLAVIGDYGFGKSHFIELAAQRALQQNFIVMSASLDLVEVPPTRPREIYRTLVASTRYPDSKHQGLHDLLKKAGDHSRVLNELMNIAPLGDACPLVMALNALTMCGSQAAYEDIVQWISGQIGATNELRTCLKKPPALYKVGEVARQYGYLLTGISVLAHLVGYSGLAILIDESEHYSLLRVQQRERADSFFKAMIYAAMGSERIAEDSIPYHYRVNYPFPFAARPNLFFLFALTESENRLPVDQWLAPSQLVRLDDRFIEKDIYRFMDTLADYHALAYGYTPDGSQHEIVESAPGMLARTLAQHRINLRELIRTAVALFDLLFLYDAFTPGEVLGELADGLGL